ncbi:MAG: GspH/FimT family pseudopilin [Motiliproteus sp.]
MNVNNARENLTQALFSTEKCRSPKRARGFTLIELLIVLAIVAILLMVASPNFDSIISGSKVDETRLGLATSLALARTEAIKRGETIRICAGTTGTCGSAVSGTVAWANGWRVQIESTNELLQVVQQNGSDAEISYDCGNFISYSNSGARGSSSGTCTFTISNNGISKVLTINATGRVRMN